MYFIRTQKMAAAVFVIWAMLFAGSALAEIGIMSTGGSWSPSIGVNELLAGAGSDLISSYESNSSIEDVTITGTANADDAWRVDVKRTDSIWNGLLALSVKRTSDGAGGGSIAGGTFYQVIDAIDSVFFSGAGDRSSVTMQLKLSGVSLQIPPDTYSTTITYTVVDI